MIEIKFNEPKNKSNKEEGLLDNELDENEEEGEENLEEENNTPLEDRLCAQSWKVRRKAYDQFYRNLKEFVRECVDEPSEEEMNSAEHLMSTFKVESFLDDTNSNSLEAALNVVIYISEKQILLNSISEEKKVKIFKSAIEKAFACSKTPVKLRSKELICNLLESSNNIYPYLEALKSIIQFSPKKAKTVLLGQQILLFLISEYGCVNLDYKIFTSTLINLIEKANHGTRHEAMEIFKEIYRHVRSNILPELKGLKDNYMKELKNAFDKIDENETMTPKPNRILNCSVVNETKNAEENKEDHNNQEEIKQEEYFTTPANNNRISINNNENQPNITLLDKYDEAFTKRLQSKEVKWSEKKEMLDEFINTVISHKISDIFDYRYEYLFNTFKSLLKDANVNIVQIANTAVSSLSNNVNKSFTPYAKEFLPFIFEKFKEKKEKLNKEIMNTLSAFFKNNITLDETLPYISNIPSDKSTQFKVNVCEFLLMQMKKTYKGVLKKCSLELFGIFSKLSDEQNADLRNLALNCLALLHTRVGQEVAGMFGDLNENKKNKIEEFTKQINYDKTFDVDPKIEKSDSHVIKINRKSVSKESPNKLASPSNNSNTESKNKNDQTSTSNFVLANSENAISLEATPLTTNKRQISPVENEEQKIQGADMNAEESVPVEGKKQNDIDQFTRMLEEAMKKESEKSEAENRSNTPNRIVVKKAVQSKKVVENDDDDDGSKLNKAEVEDRINSMIGDEIAALLQSAKWDEKKNGLIQLNEWINYKIEASISTIQSNLENLVIFIKVVLKDYKESNFNIIREASLIYTNLITKMADKGFDKRFSAMIIKGLYEKLAETKLKEHISNMLLEMMESYGPRFIITNLLKHLNNEKKQPGNSVLREYSSFFEKVIEDFGINFIPVKDVVEFCKILASNTNPQVRNASTSLICLLYKYVGKDLKFLLKEIKESTMKVIDAELEKVKVGEIPEPKRSLKSTALKEEGIKVVTNSTNNKSSGGAAVLAQNPLDSLIPRVDISKKITSKLLKDINTGKWPEKKEACEAIEKVLNEANMKIQPNGLNELFSTIKARLADGNKNMVRLIVNLLGKLIDAVGVGFKTFTKTISGPLINNLSDKMQMLREDVLVCMDKWVTQAGLDSIIIYIPQFLKQDNFEMRTELFKFLQKYKDSFIFIKDKFDLKEFVSPLLLCLQDKSQSIRTSAEELIAYSLRFINHSHFINGLKDFKTAIVNTLKPILDKYRGVNEEDFASSMNLSGNMSNSTTLKQDKSGDLKRGVHPTGLKSNSTITGGHADKSLTPTKKEPGKEGKDSNQPDNTIKVIKKAGVCDKNLINKKNKDDDPLASNSTTIKSGVNPKSTKDTGKTGLSPRLVPNSIKKNSTQPNLLNIFNMNPTIKTTKEKRFEIDKKYKFNLETLNEDFINKLKDQTKLIFTSEFMTKMFHDDLKQNIDAMNSLHSIIKEQDLNLNLNIYDYMDLILKWLGWKCNNNQNPMLVKAMLEFLETLFDKLTEKEEELNDTEGYIIITVLIDKLAANNTKVRETSRGLIGKYLDKVSNKFSLIVNGSANKNPKVKAECVDICSGLVENFGVNNALHKDLKFLAKSLSINDTTLKNALINLFAQVYIQVQDNLWAILSDTPDKLKEMLYNNFYSQGLIKDDEQCEEEEEGEGEASDEEQNEGDTTRNTGNTGNNNSKINIENNRISMNNIESTSSLQSNKNMMNSNSNNTLVNNRNVINTGKKNSSLSSDSLVHVPINNVSNSISTNVYHKPIKINNDNMHSNSSSQSSVSNLSSINVNDKDSLIYVLENLNTGEMSERVNVILIIHELVHVKFNQSKHILVPNIDLIINAFVLALKNLFENKSLNEIPIKMGKYLLTVLYKIASNKDLIKGISYDVLFALSEEVLSNLLIENLDKVGENQEGVVIIRSLNSTMLRVLENCNYTHVIAVLLELVRKYRKINEKSKICGLAVKCLLKINLILPQIIDCLHVDVILVKIHELLSEIEESSPDLSANNQAEQNVIRYIKNLVNELVKLKKDAIISDYIKGVEGHHRRDNYLKKWIKSVLSSLSTENNQNTPMGNQNKSQELIVSNSTQNIENLIAYKNKLQQNNQNTSKSPVHEVRTKPQSSSTSTSPTKKPRNSEMYNKIINLKSKLANYNNNSTSSSNLQKQTEDLRSMSKTFIDNSPDIPSQDLTDTSNSSSNKPIMSKINELKKKWNDVSNKSKAVNTFTLTPDKSRENLVEPNETSNMDKLNEIKNKYNVSKMKNINNSGNKK